MSTVEKDLNLLGLSSFTMDKIKNMKKSSFMNKLKRRIEKQSFEKLQQKKMAHSKVNKLEHSEINSKISAAKPIRNIKKKKLN